MSRITKEIAADVATKLLSGKNQEIEKLKEDLRSFVKKCYMAALPKEVVAFFEGPHKEFLRTIRTARFIGEGLGYEYYAFNEGLPQINNIITLNSKEAAHIVALNNKIKDLSDGYRMLYTEIENALYAYHTYKNVESEFPEAYALLPVKTNTGLMVNIKDIRCKLNTANCKQAA